MRTVQGFSLVHFMGVAALQRTALRRRDVEPSPFGQSFCNFITVYKLTEVSFFYSSNAYRWLLCVLGQRPLTAAVTLPMAIETGAFQDRLEISAASQGGCKHHKERHLLATPTRM